MELFPFLPDFNKSPKDKYVQTLERINNNLGVLLDTCKREDFVEHREIREMSLPFGGHIVSLTRYDDRVSTEEEHVYFSCVELLNPRDMYSYLKDEEILPLKRIMLGGTQMEAKHIAQALTRLQDSEILDAKESAILEELIVKAKRYA